MDDAVNIQDDMVLPFQIEASDLRGRVVRLGPALDAILQKHGYPDPVAQLLAETVVIGAALAAMLKYQGKFTLQARGDGPVGLVVADSAADGALRGYAQYDAEAVARMGDEGIGLLGRGHLAFTVEQPDEPGRESYQGIVELRGGSMAEAAHHYFRESEQIPTGLVIAARRGEDGAWRGGGVLLQHVPRAAAANDNDDDGRSRAMILLGTCTPEELVDPALPSEQLLLRLFHEDGVLISETRPLRHECACSTRIHDTLRLFGREEVDKMAEDGIVTMTCQFCNTVYRYDEAAVEEIFSA